MVGSEVDIELRLREEAAKVDELASVLTKGKTQVSEAGDAMRAGADTIKALRGALAQAALDLHEAAGRFASHAELNMAGCSFLTRGAARRADAALEANGADPKAGRPPVIDELVERFEAELKRQNVPYARLTDGPPNGVCIYNSGIIDLADLAHVAADYQASILLAMKEALVDARAALHQHYVDWDGEPEDAVPLQLARAKIDATLNQGVPGDVR
jgi:hypothetical protein